MKKYLLCNDGRVMERFDFAKRAAVPPYEHIPCFYCDFFTPFPNAGTKCPNAEQCRVDRQERGNVVIYKVANWLDGKIDWSSSNIKEFVYIGLNF